MTDTGALLALADQHDSHHDEAVDCLRRISEHRLPLFISLPTIYESHRRFLFSLGNRAAESMLTRVYDGTINVVRTVSDDESEARRLLGRYRDLDFTLVDAVNMAVMVRLRIAAAFSFDRHYLQAGFVRIPPFHL